MNIYQFYENDQKWNNWLVFDEPDPDSPVGLKERYRKFVCFKCRRMDEDAVFRNGFDPDIRIRTKDDIIVTCDNFFCINERLFNLIKKQKIQGLEFQSLGQSGWHAMNVTMRVNAKSEVYESSKAICPSCRRAESVLGRFNYLSDIKSPALNKVFFTPKFDRQGYQPRDIFATEDVVKLFKENQIKGGCFSRLLTADEEVRVRETTAQGKIWWPPSSKTIVKL